MIWNKSAECEPVEQRRLLQGYGLRKQVAHLYENVPFYRKKNG
jgi:phenylacetate-coenzyme A ligase PaaK-like adenylate-forming protein